MVPGWVALIAQLPSQNAEQLQFEWQKGSPALQSAPRRQLGTASAAASTKGRKRSEVMAAKKANLALADLFQPSVRGPQLMVLLAGSFLPRCFGSAGPIHRSRKSLTWNTKMRMAVRR